MYDTPAMFIAGEWIDSRASSGAVKNPANGEVLGSFPHAGPADLERAVDAAEAGLRDWRALMPAERCAVLARAAGLLRDRIEEIARIVTLEQGKPLAEARGEVLGAARLLDWDAVAGRHIYGQVVPSDAGSRVTVVYEPIGVVAGFAPWNFPLSSSVRKIGSALAAGCSVILKTAEKTPATGTALVRCLADAGIPRGVVGLVFGEPAAISEFLIGAPAVRMITLTGSVGVGKLLAAQAGAQMKPSLMELGGHAPVIICDDVDAAAVGRLAAGTKFRNAGQICTAPSRFIVHDDVYEPFVESFVEATRSLRVGDGMDAATTMGPLTNPDRCEAMERMIADAQGRAATVRTGGHRIGNRGNFFEPTVLTDVDVEAEVMRDEPFGPVAPIVRFDDLDKAVALANAVPYGLAAYAFTNSATRAGMLAERIESGGLAINQFVGSMPESPFGGVKDSGYGREGGCEGVRAFLTSKSVFHRYAAPSS